LPARPPTFCVGCPERPVFSAMKLVAEDVGRPHVSVDVGCHAFATFEPFSQGNTLLGYGMSLASSAGVSPLSAQRPLAVMGDGGFWHNGLLSGVASNLMNHGDAVLVIMKNGYASATGTQELLSTPPEDARAAAGGKSAAYADRTIENTLRGLGVKWLRTVYNYRVADMMSALRSAYTTPERGLKVIVAEGECQLERQRRLRPPVAARLKAASAWRAPASVSTRTCARAIPPASACRAAPRSRCAPPATRSSSTRWRTSTTAAWAAGCAGRWRTRRCCARRSSVRRSCRTPGCSTGCSIACARASSPASSRRSAMALPERPVTILIAALGAAGAGVLADWIIAAANLRDYPVQ